MPSNTTRVVPVRLPLEWYAEILASIESASRTTSYAGDLPQDTGVSAWIRAAIREVLDKPARSRASRERAREDISPPPTIPQWGNKP